MKNSGKFPLISVIIPTYNYAHFIVTAINSVLQQTYPNTEIIVIDDGSADDTKRVVTGCSSVKYYYQANKGLSAARNAGIDKSSGSYLVFLDADDWLEQDALWSNYTIIKDKPEAAFVSGNYYLLRKAENTVEAVTALVENNHYCRLLQSNYIGMHAAVLFQRRVFDEFRYDETLQSCEDYDLYLAITRKYPVVHHNAFIATYYFHSAGLSHNYQKMTESVTAVIKKQLPFIQTPEEYKAYEQGLQQGKQYETLMQEKKMNG